MICQECQECGIFYYHIDPKNSGWTKYHYLMDHDGSFGNKCENFPRVIWLQGSEKKCRADLEHLCRHWSYNGYTYRTMNPMNRFKVTFDNGDFLTAAFQGTKLEAENHYIGSFFNLGVKGNTIMVKAIAVDQV